MKRFTLCFLLISFYVTLFAQEIVYVSTSGSGSGRIETDPTTFASAKSIILAGEVKKIIIIGILDFEIEFDDIRDKARSRGITLEEIIITGIPGATGARRAVLSRAVRINRFNVRFEHIEISDSAHWGIMIAYDGIITLGPGAVVRNNQGSGVHLQSGGTLIIDGGEVRDNNSGGIVIIGEHSTVTMHRGVIRDNRSPNIGGGVSINPGGHFTMTGGLITGNSAVTHGGGVVVLSGGRFDQTGGTISGNVAGQGSNPNVIREQGTLGTDFILR